ncbi:SpoIIE family protein phosphatase [bacterium]|nr:SpoIIE family protein phosphatase [bacterium]
MNSRAIAGFIWLVILYVILAWAINVYKPLKFIAQLNQISVIRTSVSTDSLSQAILFDEVREKEFEGRVIPIKGDTLLSVHGETPTPEMVARLFNVPGKKGTKVPVTIGSSLGRFEATLVYLPQSRNIASILLLLLTILPIPFFIVAIWAMIRRWQNAGVRVLAMLIMSLSVFFLLTLQGILTGMEAGAAGNAANAAENFRFPWYNIPAMILSSMNTGFWFHLAFLFPSPSKFMRKNAWVVYLLAYVVNFGFVLPVLINPALAVQNTFSLHQVSSMAFGISQAAFAFVMFIVRGVRTESPLEKRQIKVLLQSVGLGILIMVLFSLGMVLFVSRDIPNELGILISFAGIVAGLMLIPGGFAYAFSKYRLLEVEGRIKRGFTLLLSSGGLLVVVFVLFYLLSNLALNTFGWEGRSRAIFFSLVLALAYVPVHNWLQGKIEKRIFHTRWKLREMLENFLEITSSLPNRASLWEEFGSRLRKNIGVKNMHVFLLDPKMRQFQRLNGETVELPGNGALQQELQKHVRALSVEELEGSNEIVVSTQEKEWLHDLGATVLVPIQVHKELIGMMALEFEYGYDEIRAEELDILASITTRVALENENLRLLEENIEKQRLEEQLATARKVQQQFLPESLPDTPGLQISATCSFCLEVAGDTFDVIPIEDGSTLFAVGDVSGKGAGAAMIMANVQASLRALTDTGVSLANMIKKINTLIAQSTAPEQFITYFAAIYDPVKKAITYVNAGHNPPRIVRSSGEVVELTEGGLILGMMGQMPYEEATLPFEAGDILVAFTDGISEATNPADEMFGEEKIVEVVSEKRAGTPDAIHDALTQNLQQFIEDVPIEDDVTIFIAKAE